ncbi:hypothetical protein [Candidatus Viridilinea mediisalina]|uniref:Uncharacterized protein n=1 Tax=Candidatus Viridilinea mediisalina TaxID=2024553 RepID=A0A2A6RI63_9CHLR|nr:hypothetical protein [Candidatus Viridilinea mediisalina]PDW02631.1 hypothetical protein CJ255_12980 [Candidatus Viridilinea mediisalina]
MEIAFRNVLLARKSPGLVGGVALARWLSLSKPTSQRDGGFDRLSQRRSPEFFRANNTFCVLRVGNFAANTQHT